MILAYILGGVAILFTHIAAYHFGKASAYTDATKQVADFVDELEKLREAIPRRAS